MLHGIFKQYQIHGCIELIVALQGVCEDGLEWRPVCNRNIGGFVAFFGKVAIEERQLCHFLFLQSLENDTYIKSFKSFDVFLIDGEWQNRESHPTISI